MSNDLEKWLNKKESSRELITDSLIQKFEACLSADVDLSNLLGLHWCLAQPIESNFNLSEDGHIKKGNFMPPIPLEQRMWASSSINFYKNLSSLNEIKNNGFDDRFIRLWNYYLAYCESGFKTKRIGLNQIKIIHN